MKLHPPSILVGAGLLGGLLIAASAARPAAVAIEDPLSVVGVPDPLDMLIVREGSPMSLPAGKLFVLTALGFATRPLGGTATISAGADGVGVSSGHGLTTSWMHPINEATPSVVATPSWVARGPTTLVVQGAQGVAGRAWGYLLDETARAPVFLPGVADPLRFVGNMDPRDFRTFGPGQAFTVPLGKALVIVKGAFVKIDGTEEVGGGSWHDLPAWLTVRGGSVVEDVYAGYLIDDAPRRVRRPQ